MIRMSAATALLGLLSLTTAPAALADAVPTLGVDHPLEYATGFGTVKPAGFSLTSMASGTIQQITWDSWGDPQAVGHGLASTGASQPMAHIKVIADDLGTCRGQFVYRRLTEINMDSGSGSPLTADICNGKIL